jgi:phosphoribosylamine--glycine ligase
MKVLVIGGGGREHALAWKLAHSPRIKEVLVAPGNPGTAATAKCRNVDLSATDLDGLLALAQREQPAFTVVGPEAPLVAGIVDRFQAAHLPIFGPTAAAAQLEGSKAFAKDFMLRHGIPTAAYGIFTDLTAAEAFIRAQGAPIVVKADGLAAGKGVIVAQTEAEALAAVQAMLGENRFGAAGRRVIIEECLYGEEVSFISLVANGQVLPLATAQDHKARDDGDLGPNTGGMGAYSPAPRVSPALHARILEDVFAPTLRGLAAEGIPYTGFLYAGLMVTTDGCLRVLEFNCRCGDPETQPILARLQTDLVDLIEAALAGHLHAVSAVWDPRPALGIVMAAAGYPESYHRGEVISGLDGPNDPDLQVFQAGTRQDAAGQIVTDGGRVLCVVGLGEDLRAAQRKAYAGIARIHFTGGFFRSDIGHRAL